VADSISVLTLGLCTGLLFGFVLQKGQVTKFPVIVGQFLLKDFTVLKVMLTAIVVGGIGIYTLNALGLATLHPKPAMLVAVPLGGAIFGVGMVLLGYCPGTGVAAAAEGHRDAMFGVLGMLVGAAAFSEVFGSWKDTLLKWNDLGPVTLPQLTGIPAWVFLAVLTLAALALFRALERHAR
jgi:uncharacterized membrane protein YedE/YeeE